MLVKERTRVDEVRQAAMDALYQAYGRSQATPDGMYCMMGRIDRAYDIVVANGNQPKHLQAIQGMQEEANKAFAKADQAVAAYRRVCRMEGADGDIEEPECDCPHCKRVPTFGGE